MTPEGARRPGAGAARRRALAIALGVLAGTPLTLASGTPPALAAATPPALLHAARLQGFYATDGVVTWAVGVPGEHRGEHVARTWAFISSCHSGACATVELVRTRAAGNDKLLLTRRRPGFYSGVGAFVAPVRCQGRLYRKGELATFTITVRITAAVTQGTVVQATGFTAAYTGAVRTGLTRCFSSPSRDSASYTGSEPATAATRSAARLRRL